MAWLVVGENETEWVFDDEPKRGIGVWTQDFINKSDDDDIMCVNLPTGSIHKLIGRVMTWDDEPYELI